MFGYSTHYSSGNWSRPDGSAQCSLKKGVMPDTAIRQSDLETLKYEILYATSNKLDEEKFPVWIPIFYNQSLGSDFGMEPWCSSTLTTQTDFKTLTDRTKGFVLFEEPLQLKGSVGNNWTIFGKVKNFFEVDSYVETKAKSDTLKRTYSSYTSDSYHIGEYNGEWWIQK